MWTTNSIVVYEISLQCSSNHKQCKPKISGCFRGMGKQEYVDEEQSKNLQNLYEIYLNISIAQQDSKSPKLRDYCKPQKMKALR